MKTVNLTGVNEVLKLQGRLREQQKLLHRLVACESMKHWLQEKVKELPDLLCDLMRAVKSNIQESFQCFHVQI